MTIYRPELTGLGPMPDLPLKLTHPKHMTSQSEDFLSEGSNIMEMSKKIGAGAITRSGTFEEAMFGALDQVSAYQQFASSLNQAASTDPHSVDVHDITVAQAMASLSLNITRNVLNRVVQGWRDLINTR